MKIPVYQPITSYLAARSEECLTLSFPKMEEVLGRKLPPTAYNNDTWWTNNPTGHSQAKAWLAAGFEMTALDRRAQTVTFRRMRKGQGKHSSGMSEPHRMFKTENTEEKKSGPHPLIGAMKGTFAVEPGYDLTNPVYTDEEWAEIEKEMEADWNQIEEGLSGGKSHKT